MKDIKRNLYGLTVFLYVFFAIVTDSGSITMKLARLALAGVWGIKILSEKNLKTPSYILRMIPFLLFSALTVNWAESTEFASAMTKTLLFNFVCMWALFNLIDNRKENVDLALKAMVFAPLALEARVILRGGIFAFMNNRWAGNISGNAVGLCAAFGACIALYYWIQGAKKYGLLVAVNSAIVLLSGSKKALLFLAIPVMILYIMDTRIDRRQRLIRCGVVVVTGLIGLWLIMRVPVLYRIIGSRIEAVFALLAGRKDDSDFSSRVRARLFNHGVQWVRERPLLGFGIDNFRYVIHKRHGWEIEYYAHNNYLELLVDTGIVGTVLYYWNYADMMAKGIRSGKSFANKERLIFGIFISLVISEITQVTYFEKDIQVLLLVVWIMLTEFDRTVKEAK